MKKLSLCLSMAAMLAFSSCDNDLEVVNTNNPDAERALANTADLLSLLEGATLSIMDEQLSLMNVHINLMCDQTTTTNMYLDFWVYSDEPRRTLSNLTTNDNLAVISQAWGISNSTIATANQIIGLVQGGTILKDDSGADVTQKVLAGAYFIRGMAHGTIGMTYDKGYVVGDNADLATLDVMPYSDVMAQAISDMEKTIEVINSNNVGWSFTTAEYDATTFKQIAYSYMARYLAGGARNSSEAASVDWAKVKSAAQNGLTVDFMPNGQTGVIFNTVADWSQFVLSDGAHYLPSDLKIPSLFDTNYPKSYPASGLLGTATSADKRLGLYYQYSEAFGYLREDRNRSIFSNYGLIRWYGVANNVDYDNSKLPFFLKAENDYLLAEAELMLGNAQAALNIINAGPRATVGELPASTDASVANVKHMLFYEYSIELDNTSKGLQWAFMRRHDMLQVGTPTHYPVPANEMELLQRTPYTFGGDANVDGVNTASGTSSWK